MIVLAEGDRVPADAVLRRGHQPLAPTSRCSPGESVPVRKARLRRHGRPLGPPGGDDLPFVFSGTLVTAARAWPRSSPPGRAPSSARSARRSRLETGADAAAAGDGAAGAHLRRRRALARAPLVVVVYAPDAGRAPPTVWKEGLLAGITLAMATLPEEFPVVLTIFLALGAWRISQSRVLTRRMPAIETLGAATVLCVDKTGTLTAEPDVGAAAGAPTARSLRRGRRRRSAARRRSTRCSSTRSWPASATLRPDGEGPPRGRRPAPRAAPSTCTETGRWCASTRCRPSCWRCRHVWRAGDGAPS